MYTLNAFVEIPSLCDNAVDKIAKFGELSGKSRTFTKDTRNYVDKSAYPQIELTTFAILDDKSAPVENPPETLTSTALSVANFFYTQYSNNAIPLPSSKATLISAVTSEIPTIRTVKIGEILESLTPGKRLIDYVTYDMVIDTRIWRVTLWFSDSKFRVQYPNYEIVVIPPLGDIGRLIDKPGVVLEAINSIKLDYVINRMAIITSEHSATTVYMHTLNWHDPEGSNSKIETKWTVVIYGAQGNDLDLIKDAIRAYIASNHPSDKWLKIFPDLYSENEFLLIPLWGLLATPSDTYDDGLYSSIVNWSDMDIQSNRLIPGSYTNVIPIERLKQQYVSIIATMYRGLSVLAVGNPNNVGSKILFKDMFQDYMAVSTERPDFARMSNMTQEFVLEFLNALEVARNYSLNTVLPVGYTKSSKANREYVGFEYNGFTYYILTRMGYLKNL